MPNGLNTPTQENNSYASTIPPACQLYRDTGFRRYRNRGERCDHGFLRELKTCPKCFTSPSMKGFNRVSQVLQLLALKQVRVKSQKGKFEPVASRMLEETPEGFPLLEYHCWRCKRWFLLTSENFRRAASKATGFQTRCKLCDNSLKTEKKRAPRIEIERYASVGM
jgi:hypothetical protein